MKGGGWKEEEEEGENECVGTAGNTTCSSAQWLQTGWSLLLKSWKAPSLPPFHSPQNPQRQNPVGLSEVTNVA